MNSFNRAWMTGALLALSIGCSDPTPTVESLQPLSESLSPNFRQTLELMDELTSVFYRQVNDQADGAFALQAVRSWVESHQKEAVRNLNELHKEILAMSEPERDAWRAESQSVMAERLDRYGQAQISFQKLLNETQKWELGEILAQLKSP